ncbi:PKD domain-containing protein [Marivirga arenosa]|uniref:PKD domain-containing protein n=1 Tax=Marivirga arenosa TaxID=3059076 RepID=A0AA51ZWM3_9BACT|nr:PKD domain-containing protein [Marivirga sp. BKB1-2]WNB18076.1 PKD domain-containing protein [Marivirga sp. BKB1-2]
MKQLFILVVFLFCYENIFGQIVNADFDLPNSVCLEENISLTNNSINFDSLEWDFCFTSITDETTVSELTSLTDARRPLSADYIRLDNIWYGLAVNWASNTITRMTFRNGIDSAPTLIEDLGNVGNQLSQPASIRMIIQEDTVYALVHNWSGQKLVSLKFANGISNVPIAKEVYSGVGQSFPKMEIINSPTELIAGIINPNGTLQLVDFRNNIQNNITATNIYTSSTISGMNDTRSIKFIEEGGNWYGFVGSFANGNIGRLDFGSNLMDGFENSVSNVTSNLYEGGSINNIEIIKEGLEYRLHILTFQGRIFKVNLGVNIDTVGIISGSTRYGNESSYAEGYNIRFIKDSGEHKGILINDRNRRVYIINTYSNCSSNVTFSVEMEPSPFYLNNGVKVIELTAFDSNGNSSTITKEITVTNNQAPNITYTTGDNLCISNPIQFSSQSTANISSYNWDFGDGNTSTAENPAYNYSTPGDYEVRLNVTDANGCNNLFVDTVSVYAEPVADFQATAQGSICSQKPIMFENLASLPTEATFEWDLGDGTTSTEENPVHEYAAAGDYTITQIINMAGCVVEKTKTITVNPGPLVSFETNNNCLGELIQFANTSEGEFLDNYTWDLGDGTQTTQANPSHQYDTAGVYQVQLTAFTTNGCDFTITQEVEISPLANVAFEADVACANQDTQFTQLVTVDQSNITDYLWDFGVAGVQTDISSEADPEFIFPEAGTYEVGLQVTTSDGCTSFSSQSITVNEVPNAEFDAENNCIGQLRKFTPQDTINSISHFWELRDNVGSIVQTSQETVFEYQFDVEGTYELTYRQENENLCSSTNSQLIEIYEEPLPDFSWDKACVGTAIQIENLSDLKGNSLKSYNWSIDGEIRSNALNPEFIFEDTGSYEINLILETQSGCSQNISKIIDIKPSPESFFQLNQKVGAYPFDIATTADNADIISSVLWTLDGDSISSDQELTYTINEVGTYLLGLRLVNAEGCVDEYFEQIKVREPSLDVALNNLTVNEDCEFTSFILNIRNRGSLVPERIDLRIDLGSYEVTETVNAPIYPEDNRNYSLSLKLTEEQRKGLKKICIEASAKSSIIDEDNLVNNKVCTNLESGFQVLEIYPNPAISQITIPIITPESDVLSFRLEDSNGKNINNFNYSLEAGYNEISFQRDNISSGVYFLRFRFQGEEVIKKLIFQ